MHGGLYLSLHLTKWRKFMTPINPSFLEIAATVIFVVAVLHTFSASYVTGLAARYPKHSGLLHLLGEVEIVFGFWALVLMVTIFFISGKDEAISYLENRNFTEPMFVLAIMVVAASRPILKGVIKIVQLTAKIIPIPREQSVYFLSLSLVPLLGSFITEPAAMTLAAVMLKENYFSQRLSERLQYATLGVLFVNISIGGTLTHFAAPPVLMVAAKWQWDTMYMLTHFGWRSALAVLVNAAAVTWIFRHELVKKAQLSGSNDSRGSVPLATTIVHVCFLIGVVFFAHYPAVFMGLFLFFIGYTQAYKEHQDRLFIREGLLVAFFLAGLVTLGGLQQWWLQATLSDMDVNALYYISTALTAITDNAALTYLGSLVEGVSEEFKYALVAGAVTGGGLTVIANAPNPAGFSILKECFRNETISPLYLLMAALMPTLTAIFAFRLI